LDANAELTNDEPITKIAAIKLKLKFRNMQTS
jgi:hypothetical protein